MAEKLPKLVRRQRTKGYRIPPNTRYIGRPSPFGNPFDTAEAFEVWLKDGSVSLDDQNGWLSFELDDIRSDLLAAVPGLRGMDLCCWPHDGRCHGEILLELANA